MNDSRLEAMQTAPADASGQPVCATLPDGGSLRGLIYPADADAGPAPLCLCIHGLGVDANVWRFVAPLLRARGLTVLCFDLPGHGLSDGGTSRAMRTAAMAHTLRDALGSLGLEPDVVVAQSFGTCVALELLRRYPDGATRPTLYAVTPIWTGTRKSLRSLPRTARNTVALLWRIGRRVGFRSRRRTERRDHTRYAAHPDSYLPRFAEEAASISWLGYARLLTGLRLRDYFAPGDWAAIAHWPVRMIGATDEGLWNNRELEIVQQKTGWPLHWLEMRHVSLATDSRYAEPLVALLADGPGWPRDTPDARS
jgi:pimeloyl-ACP methyl ester carboxylesterase